MNEEGGRPAPGAGVSLVGILGGVATAMGAIVGFLLLLPSLVPLPPALGRLLPAPIALGLDVQGGLLLRYDMVDVPDDERAEALDAAVEVVRRRIDALELGDCAAFVAGEAIEIQLSGTSEEEVARARALVGEGHRLELAAVDETTPLGWDPAAPLAEVEVRRDAPRGSSAGGGLYLVATGPDAAARLEAAIAGAGVPPGRRLAVGPIEEPAGEGAARTYLLETEGAVTGDRVADASVFFDEVTGRPAVAIGLDREGAEAFAALTAAAVGRRLAIVLDDRVVSAPVVQEPIRGGRAVVTLGPYGSAEEELAQAQDLAISLRSGALPHPLVLAEEALVHPRFGGAEVLAAVALSALLLLAFAVVAVVRHGAAGLAAGLAPPLAALFAASLFALLGAILTAASAAALAVGAALAAASALAGLEPLRRGPADRAARLRAGLRGLGMAGLTLHGLAFAAGVLLLAFASGPLRGFATALLVTTVASAGATLLWTTVAVDLASRRRPSPPRARPRPAG